MRRCLVKIVRYLIALPGLAAATVLAPTAALAGCGDDTGQIQVCFKGRCDVQKMVRHCSSAVAGNHWISVQGYQLGYSNPIAGRYT